LENIAFPRVEPGVTKFEALNNHNQTTVIKGAGLGGRCWGYVGL